MARPTKQGIDYFPLDCTLDSKIELYIAEAGIESFGILIFLWQMIYRDKGYYINYSDDIVLLLRKHTLSEPETIKTAIETGVKRGIFNEKLYKKYGVLTSSGIQKRYLTAAKKKKTVVVRSELILIDISDAENVVIDDENPVSSDEKPPKEKERKSKRKEKKETSKTKNYSSDLKNYLLEKIPEANLEQHTDKITEFFEYRMSLQAKDRYKTQKGINGLFRDLHGCQKTGLDIEKCLETTMEREWLTPNPEYFNNSGRGGGNGSWKKQHKKKLPNNGIDTTDLSEENPKWRQEIRAQKERERLEQESDEFDNLVPLSRESEF